MAQCDSICWADVWRTLQRERSQLVRTARCDGSERSVQRVLRLRLYPATGLGSDEAEVDVERGEASVQLQRVEHRRNMRQTATVELKIMAARVTQG